MKNLLDYLIEDLKIDRKKAKAMLTNKAVLINNKVVTKYNYQVKVTDEILINQTRKSNLKIIYEDNDLIVIDKEAGLLTIGSDKEKEKTLYHEVSDYLKKKDKKNKVFVIHRLDKDTSGIVMFAKSEKIKKLFQDNWNDLVKYRKYYALVTGVLKKSGKIESHLKENKNHQVYSSKEGDYAVTLYDVIKSNDKYTLLDVNILTGRKNQIRVHMKDINHPIVGDKKYGGEKFERLGLHAYYLELIDPRNKKILKFESKLPPKMKI